jgi:hypothetical protein
MRSAARFLLSLLVQLAFADAFIARRTTVAGFSTPSRRGCQGPTHQRSFACCLIQKSLDIHSTPRRSLLPALPQHLLVAGSDSIGVSSPSPLTSIVISSESIGVYFPSVLRATASAVVTYVGIVAYLDRPRGTLRVVENEQVRVQQSTVPGAGLGLFVATDLPRGTVLGTYPGVVIPLVQHTRKLREFPACEGYIWRFSDNQMVIDPTNQRGELEEIVVGGNPSQPGSVFLFESILSKLSATQASPTILCRINEPPRGKDVNVVTREDIEKRTVSFELERVVYRGEELFIDYGLSYDRSRYGGEFINTAEL